MPESAEINKDKLAYYVSNEVIMAHSFDVVKNPGENETFDGILT